MCRPLWGLHCCMATVENATFACAANEEHLVALRMPGSSGHAGQRQPSEALPSAQLPASAPAAYAVEAPASAAGMRADASGAASQPRSVAGLGFAGSPGKERLASMRDRQSAGSQGAALGESAMVRCSSYADGFGGDFLSAKSMSHMGINPGTTA